MNETVYTWAAPPITFGDGAVDEIGYDALQLGIRRALVLTDAGVVATGVPARVVNALRARGVEATLFDGVHVEPTDASMRAAVAYATENAPEGGGGAWQGHAGGETQSGWDGFVAVGGGSSIDTAKAVNLLTTYPDDLMAYVNRPIGRGIAPPGPLKPLLAVPTTAGTGAECTTVTIMDILDKHVKTGISHARLRPTRAIVDPSLTLSLPPMVTAATGFDVLCHALESYTARPFSSYDRRKPEERVAYNGANPISDVWIEHTLPLHARSFRTAVHEGGNLAARTDMLQAAMFAGMGFGNAGVHVPHACAYPIAGRVRDFRPADYPADEPIVPHGMAVVLTAPAVFARTYATSPERHAWAAGVLDASTAAIAEPAERLPEALRRLIRDTGLPNGLADLGYTSADVPDLVAGAVEQQRLLTIAPIEADEALLASVFEDSMRLW